MKFPSRICAVLVSGAMLLGQMTPCGAAAEINVVASLFTGEKPAEAWTTAVSVNVTDETLLCADTMVKIVSKGNAAPALALSSWSGGSTWATVQPSHNVDGALYYAYADMVASFGEDLTLVDSLSVMAQRAEITVSEIAVVSAADVLAADQPTGGGERRVVGYLPDWSYTYYKQMDFDALTHINIAFCAPDEQGNFSCMIPDGELQTIVETAHAHDVKVLASLGGAGGVKQFPALVSTPARMTDMTDKLFDFCAAHDLDGIDLDIEDDVDAAFWDTYTDWCVLLRTRCDAEKMLLSTAYAAWVARHAEPEALACFDFINVMAYDNDGSPTSHSDYAFAEESLRFFHIERGIARDRLVLGVPFYGRGYNDDGTLSWTSYVPFAELVAQDPDNYNRDLYEGIAYNGAETMAKKCALAKQYGGVMIWELTQDAVGEQSLLAVIDRSLNAATELVPGDLNRDGVLDHADVKLLSDALLRLAALPDTAIAAADLNEDQRVDAFDLALLKRLLLVA